MININEVCSNLNISAKKIRYYMFTKEIEYHFIDNKFYIDEENYQRLKKIVLLRRLGLSFEDIDNIKSSKNLKKYLLRMDNMIPHGNKYDAIKKIIDIMLKDDANYFNMDSDKYLNLINEEITKGRIFYNFIEDMTYEDYKASKFHKEYLIMIFVLTLIFLISTLLGGGFVVFLTYFPYYLVGLIFTFFAFYIPIRLKYYRRIIRLLKEKVEE